MPLPTLRSSLALKVMLVFFVFGLLTILADLFAPKGSRLPLLFPCLIPVFTGAAIAAHMQQNPKSKS